MKKKLNIIIVAVLFLAGLSLLLYPFTANQWNTHRQNKLMSEYAESVAQMEEAGVIDYETQWVKAHAYNDDLDPYILPDSFAMAEIPEEGNADYRSCLNLTGDGMMGFVEIPKIGIKLPVYHTTSEEVLQKAAGHLAGSSLPVGGEGTHTVISAHRGLPSASLFTDLDQQAEEGMDLATLLTCTPYGINSHRLLVRGHRIPYEEMEEMETPLSAVLGPSLHTSYLLWVIVGLAVTGAFIVLLYLMDRRRFKRKKEQE